MIAIQRSVKKALARRSVGFVLDEPDKTFVDMRLATVHQ